MNNAYLSFESLPDKLIVKVKGQWVFDEVLALEDEKAKTPIIKPIHETDSHIC